MAMHPQAGLEDLATRLRDRLDGFYPGEPGPWTVGLASSEQRRSSDLVRFECRSRSGAHVVLAKQIGTVKTPTLRPRTAPITPPAAKLAIEADNLRLIEADLAREPDPRFAALRVLDAWADSLHLVVEEIPGRSLASLMRSVARPHRGSRMPSLEAAFASSGAWLRRFHAMDVGDVPATLLGADDIVTFVRDIATYLRDVHGAALDPDHLAAVARHALPATFPQARRHGDYAMRNIMVRPDGRIVVIDMPTRWRGPVHLDVATMLIAIRTPLIQMLSQGMAFPVGRLDRLEAAFLEGYGRDDLDGVDLDAFRLVAVLERWAARGDRFAARPAHGIRRRLLDRPHAELVRRAVAALQERRE